MSLGSWLAREGGTEALPPERAGSGEPAAPAGRGAGGAPGGCSCAVMPPPAARAGTLWGCVQHGLGRASPPYMGVSPHVPFLVQFLPAGMSPSHGAWGQLLPCFVSSPSAPPSTAGSLGNGGHVPSKPSVPRVGAGTAAERERQESVRENDECSFQPCYEAEEILGYKHDSLCTGYDGSALPG